MSSCSTTRKIVLRPSELKTPTREVKYELTRPDTSRKSVYIVNKREFLADNQEEIIVFAMICAHVSESEFSPIIHPVEIREILSEYQVIMPDELPLLHDIQHAIDFGSGSILSNRSHYRMNPTEHKEPNK